MLFIIVLALFSTVLKISSNTSSTMSCHMQFAMLMHKRWNIVMRIFRNIQLPILSGFSVFSVNSPFVSLSSEHWDANISQCSFPCPLWIFSFLRQQSFFFRSFLIYYECQLHTLSRKLLFVKEKSTMKSSNMIMVILKIIIMLSYLIKFLFIALHL